MTAERRRLQAGLISLLLAVGAERAAAQGFSGDFENVGRLEDARRQPTPLRVGPHGFEPSIVYKLFGVTTPHVFGALGGGYTDNLLREDEEAPNAELVRDLFGRAEAGLRLDTQLTEHRIELEYRAVVNEYSETGGFDTNEHQLRARLDLLFNEASAHADASYTRAAYAQSIQLRGIVRLDAYTGSAWAEARFNRFGGRIGVSGRRNDYLERALRALDHRGFGPSIQLYFRVSPKLRAVIEYSFDRLRYDDRPDVDGFDVHQLSGGVDGELTPKVSLSAKVGVGFQRIHADVAGADDREFAGLVASISARWDVLPRTQLTGSLRRGLDPSVSSSYLITDDVELAVAQKLLDEKVTARAFVGYTHSHVSPGEDLNRLRAGASITYLIRQWLSIGASYQYEKLNSAFPFDDYDAHTISVSVGAGL